MTTTISTRNSGATIEWNGYHWVAKFNGTRYADCNKKRLVERLYDAGASVVFEEFTIQIQRPTVWQRIKTAVRNIIKI